MIAKVILSMKGLLGLPLIGLYDELPVVGRSPNESRCRGDVLFDIEKGA